MIVDAVIVVPEPQHEGHACGQVAMWWARWTSGDLTYDVIPT